MVSACCVEGCNNKWGLFVGGKKVSFFKIPKASGKFGNIKKREAWLASLKQENWTPQPEDVICGVHFLTGQPSNDPKHPDYQPQIFPNRAVDMEKLQGDLSIWEKTRDRNPPVIQVTPENDVHKPQLILPKGFSYALQTPLIIGTQQLAMAAQPSAVTTLVSNQQVIMTTQQLMNAASNGIPVVNNPSTSSLVIQPLQSSSQETSGQTSEATTSSITIEKVESLNPQYVTAGSNNSKSDDTLMSSLGCKPLEDNESEKKSEKVLESKAEKVSESKLEKLASQLKSEALAKQNAGNENTQNFMNSLSLKPKESPDKGNKSVSSEPKNKRKSLPNGTDGKAFNGGDGKPALEIKIEPLDMTVSPTPTSISAAALMSHFATTALGKSVGTTADIPEFINMNELSPKKGGKSKPMKSEDIDESVISKAVIKTPVKMKNNGGDEETAVRFMTQYMCRYCAQRFDNWDKIKEHVSLHLKGKHTNHTCSVCGKEYRTPSKLQRHVRVHSGERPYACTVCGRRFTRSDHVKQHMKVHLPPQELNVCRLCGTRFLKRQSLQLHLQQAHLVNQLFTCNRCGEAFESLEQLNAHNLTHDSILNSLKGNENSEETPTLQGIAKFSVGLNVKQIDGSRLFTKLDGQRPIAPKPEPPMPKIEPKPEPSSAEQDDTMKYNYILTLDAPENPEDVTKISDKLIAESIEEESKKYEELKRQIEEHAKMMAEEAAKREEALERERKEREKAESKEIAAAFNLERANHVGDCENPDDPMDVSEYESPSVLTSEDGMSMYISTADIMKLKGMNAESSHNSDGSDSNANEMEEYSEMNIDDDKMDTEKEHVNDLNKETDKEKKEEDSKKSSCKVVAGSNKAAPYKPGPLWFKTAQHRNAVLTKQSEKILNVSKDHTSAAETSNQDAQLNMVSCIKPNINELLKAKVEQKNLNITENAKNITVPNPVLGLSQGQPIHVPIAPQAQQQVQQYILVQPQAQATVTPGMVTPVTPQTLQNSGMLKCEHCCIWFEDRAMALLHNTLHNADKNDPYTCRKCYKKMGNRLEFNAHLIWHLEPNMDI